MSTVIAIGIRVARSSTIHVLPTFSGGGMISPDATHPRKMRMDGAGE